MLETLRSERVAGPFLPCTPPQKQETFHLLHLPHYCASSANARCAFLGTNPFGPHSSISLLHTPCSIRRYLQGRPNRFRSSSGQRLKVGNVACGLKLNVKRLPPKQTLCRCTVVSREADDGMITNEPSRSRHLVTVPMYFATGISYIHRRRQHTVQIGKTSGIEVAASTECNQTLRVQRRLINSVSFSLNPLP